MHAHHRIAACVAGALAVAAHAQVHEGDVILAVEDSRIVTGGTDADGNVVFPTRVFPASFGDLPNFTNDPGFDSAPGTFDPGTLLGVDALKALHVWNGEDFWTIADETLTVSEFGQDLVTPPCDRFEAGILVGVASPTGQFHHHPNYTLNTPAETGVYLLELQMWDDEAFLETSRPFRIVFNQNDCEENHQAAVDWAIEHEFQLDCRADLNEDGALNIFDFLAFQGAITAGCE